MDLDHNACYRAVKLRDARFDGRFFTAVKTTKIYCRPVCPARTPLAKNVTFFPTAAAAQEAGFRPCLRCRPETAPDMGAWRGTSNTVSRGLALIELGALDESDVEGLARIIHMQRQASAATITKGSFRGRRESVHGGCEKNILFFTPPETPFRARVCARRAVFVNSCR
jgi:methylphosphotriester-DNA--protein-cysteine methyltransferase